MNAEEYRSSDPYEAKRQELLKRGRQALRDDPVAQRELAEFDAEMNGRERWERAVTALRLRAEEAERERDAAVEVLAYIAQDDDPLVTAPGTTDAHKLAWRKESARAFLAWEGTHERG